MAEKKTSSVKKKKKSKKPKVRLSARKVYVLCALIFSVCALSLATSVFLASWGEAGKGQGAQSAAAVAERKVEPPVPSSEQAVPRPAPLPEPVSPLPAQNPVLQKKQEEPLAVKKTAPVPAPAKQTPAAASSKLAPAPAKPATPAPAKPLSAPAAGKQSLASAKVDKSQKKKNPPAPAGKAAPVPAPQKPAEVKASPQVKNDPFNLPQAKNGATLVFVIDDAGLHVENVRKYTALPFPLAVAVLPKLSQTKACAAQIRRDGKELMLHQPMQAVNLAINPGMGKISPDMTTYQVAAQIRENIAELGGGVKGFNNHEGSLITEDVIKMGAVLETAAELGVYFLDSRTSAQSKARQAALERDMRIFERNAPFLDNAVSREEMLAEIKKSLAVANKAGYAIIIGHVDKSVEILPKLLMEMYPHLVAKGYRFATPSSL